MPSLSSTPDCAHLIRGHLAVGRDPVLQAVELPAGIAHLHARLTHVDGDALALREMDNVWINEG